MLTRITPRPTALRVSAGLSGIALAGAYALVAPGIAGAGTPLQDGCTADGDTVTCTYDPIGAEQIFLVPDGVTSIDVTAIGAAGGSGNTEGGNGASVSGELPVTADETLYIEVGGNGTGGPNGGGWNGGGDAGQNLATGGGGGASDVRTISRADNNSTESLKSRLLVAGAGGGSGPNSLSHGGDAGQDGHGGGAGGGATTTAGGHGPASSGNPGTRGIGGDGSSAGGGGGYGPGANGKTNNGGGGGGSSLVPEGGNGPTITDEAPSVTIVYTAPDDDSGEPECSGSLCMIVGSISESLADFDA